MKEQIEIPLSKKKMVLTLLGAIIFVGLGFSFLLNPPKISNLILGNPIVIFIVGLASILFFGLVAVTISRKLSDKKAGLTINKEGIINNSSGISPGEILWNDIENISVIEIHRQKLILLKVKNPQKYIDKQTNVFKRKMMQMSFNMYGTPFSITSNALKIKFDDLLDILNDYLRTSR